MDMLGPRRPPSPCAVWGMKSGKFRPCNSPTIRDMAAIAAAWCRRTGSAISIKAWSNAGCSTTARSCIRAIWVRPMSRRRSWRRDGACPTPFLLRPGIGDNGRAYVDTAVIELVRDRLAPQADILTPNRFELGLLSGGTIVDLDDALAAGRGLIAKGATIVICTSVAENEGEIGTLALSESDAFIAWTRNLSKHRTARATPSRRYFLVTIYAIGRGTGLISSHRQPCRPDRRQPRSRHQGYRDCHRAGRNRRPPSFRPVGSALGYGTPRRRNAVPEQPHRIKGSKKGVGGNYVSKVDKYIK